MKLTLKRKIVIGATGLAVMAGAGGTYAATQQGSHSDERQAFLNDVAKRLNVSPQDLTTAIQGAYSDRLDAAVTAGRLTKAQADEIKQHLKEKGGPPFLGGPFVAPGGPPGPPGPPGLGHGPGHGPFKAGFDAAAKYVGLSDAKLFEQLRSGKSLAQVAKDQGKSVDGLKTSIKDAVRAELDAAVKAKRLTQSQENQILGDLDKRIDDLVNNAGRRFGERRHGAPPWAGPGGGPHRGGGPGVPGWGGPPPPP